MPAGAPRGERHHRAAAQPHAARARRAATRSQPAQPLAAQAADRPAPAPDHLALAHEPDVQAAPLHDQPRLGGRRSSHRDRSPRRRGGRAEADLDGRRARGADDRHARQDGHADQRAGGEQLPSQAQPTLPGGCRCRRTVRRTRDDVALRGFALHLRGSEENHPRGWPTRPAHARWTGVRETTKGARRAPFGHDLMETRPTWPSSRPAATAGRSSTCSRTPPRRRRSGPGPCCGCPRSWPRRSRRR